MHFTLYSYNQKKERFALGGKTPLVRLCRGTSESAAPVLMQSVANALEPVHHLNGKVVALLDNGNTTYS